MNVQDSLEMAANSILVEQVNSLLRRGEAEAAIAELTKLNIADISQDHAVSFANLCRRAGLVSLGLKILNPMVRDSSNRKPTHAERAEYAALLYRNGSITEALQLLNQCSVKEAPESLLYKAFCSVDQWNFSQAVTNFEAYLEKPLPEYQKNLALVNYASSLLAAEDLKKANQQLDLVIQQMEGRDEYQRLLGNVYELKAQCLFQTGSFEQCRAWLKKARANIPEGFANDSLYIEKWTAICVATETNAAAPILEFQKLARQKRHWESLREALFYELKIKFDQKKFDYLYFGTPFEVFRQRLDRHFPKFQASGDYLIGKAGKLRLDLRPGRIKESTVPIPSKSLETLFRILIEDFFRPQNTGELFSRIFPGQFFDPNSSPLRVRQQMLRLRKWAIDNSIDCQIGENKGFYRLRVNDNFSVQISRLNSVGTGYHREIELLKSHPDTSADLFNMRSAQKVLGLSSATVQRILKWGLDERRLERSGKGRQTFYRFISV